MKTSLFITFTLCIIVFTDYARFFLQVAMQMMTKTMVLWIYTSNNVCPRMTKISRKNRVTKFFKW